MNLSVIIPARNEKYLQRTIDSILENIETDTEIIAVCDGYWPDPPIQDHERVLLIHHTEARGQRQSINEAARIARGEYIMKLDAHCAVAPGFDRVLIENHQPGWTQVPRMYNLNAETWEPKLHKITDYMYIGFNDRGEMRAQYYTGREYKRWHKRAEEIDETMCCMGPGWFLSLEDFWKQGGCDEDHGSWGQQGIEVALKAWLSGGTLMVNKKTWFAHYFRGSDGGFPYPISGKSISKARSYSKDLWMGNKWEGQTKKLDWLVDKFDPPGWENVYMDEQIKQASGLLYTHLHRKQHHPQWKGINILKMPTDLLLYHQIIWDTRPKWIVETGTKFGGSALFFQDMLDMVGEGGRVITIDKVPQVEKQDPRIIYLEGSSRDEKIIKQVKEMVSGEPTMVILDSDHGRVHVKWELHYYAPLVTPGNYLVIEDCYIRSHRKYYPLEARDWFLADTKTGRKFKQTNLGMEFLVGVCVGGWLRRK